MESKRGICDKCKVNISIKKNEVGGAELYCEHCNSLPDEVRERAKELRLDLLSQFPKFFQDLKNGRKESFNFSQRYKGFIIIFSTIFE